MKHPYLFLLLFLISSGLSAFQPDTAINEKTHIFQFSPGFLQYKEANLHDFIFGGVNYNFGYTLLWQKKDISYLHFQLGNSHLQTGIGEGFSSVSAVIAIDYAYLFQWHKSVRWDIHAGLGTRLNYNISYFWVWDESHLYWGNFLGFNFCQRFTFLTDRNNRIIGSFTAPLFMFLSRPETERNYKIDDLSFSGLMKSFHYVPEAQVLTGSNSFDASLEYQYNRKNKLHPCFLYSFSFFNLKTSYSNRVQSIQHSLGLIWNL
jgi:hypothetical protein